MKGPKENRKLSKDCKEREKNAYSWR